MVAPPSSAVSQSAQPADEKDAGIARRNTPLGSLLTREEIRALVQPSDVRGLLAVLTSWAIIAGALGLVAWDANPLTIAVSLALLGGRQLGLAILMHDCSHHSLFRTRWLNDVVGTVLCAAPTWQSLGRYRTHHLAHHAYAGTERDTDLNLVTALPTTRRGLVRKFARDLSGLTGLKRIVGLVLMDVGALTYSASGGSRWVPRAERRPPAMLIAGIRNLGPVVLANGALYAGLAALGHGWLYWLWVGAYLTTFSLIIRIRSMAEHACTKLGRDPFDNTRTTHASVLARLTVAPHNVNYHFEHHLLMSVPYFRLPAMHRLLRERGAFERAPYANNYFEVLRLVTTAA